MLTTQDKKQDDKGKLKYHRTERSSTWVQRSLRLPESADLSKISAKYADGVLQMEVGTRRLLCRVAACLMSHYPSALASRCASLRSMTSGG